MNTISERALSNHVLFHESDDRKKVTIVLPSYLRYSFKKITDISIADKAGHMSGALLLGIYYKGLPPDIVKQIEGSLEVSLNS